MSNYGVVATNVRRYKVRLDRDRAEKSRVAQILKLFNCEMGDPVRLSLLVSANEDGTVKLWDVTNGQETLALKGQIGPVRSAVFSPDGKRLALANRMIQIWDARPRSEEGAPDAKTR